MKISESLSLLRKIQSTIEQRDLDFIFRICSMLGLPQKTIAVSYYNFFATKSKCRIEPDDVTLISAAVNLSCKMCETSRAIDKIIKLAAGLYSIDVDLDIIQLYITAVSKTEIEMLYFIDFNFEITEIYADLERICREKEQTILFRKKCWVVLNDILSTPMSIYFTIQEILACAIFINFTIDRFKKQGFIENDIIFSQFKQTFEEFYYVSPECMDVMIDEMSNLYSAQSK